MVLCGSRKLRNCENLLRAESKMADDVQTFNIRTQMSGTAIARDFKFGVCIDYED